MKGDFSAWRIDPNDGHLGVLYQQGRLISDADLTEAEAISLIWRITAGRDIIGANLAAVPAGDPDGFRVTRAVVNGDTVEVDLAAGRIWADGVHLSLAEPVTRTATYLPEPHNPAGTSTADIGSEVRDAVILEVSLEALNGFQDPARLIEPALGGPDTAERVIPRTALKLLRLGKDETCAGLGPRLRDDLSSHGRLTVELAPPETTTGDCPVVSGGGYAGFEHNLYRIEIAATTSGTPMFKWSQINGGLVGRGRFQGGPSPKAILTANRAAILTSGLSEFYLEALEWDDDLGNWQVTYGAPATLNADGELDLTTPATFGTLPGASVPVFFRLWNGIRAISDFTNSADPVELRDGIHLVFDAGSSAVWRPGSWWNFEMRAGDLFNPQTPIDDRPPEGPVIRRVPLAEIDWTARREADAENIEDCRRRFRPLTNQKICCTYIVGNGMTTFGDFNSVEEALRHLPPAGGRLCLLPGVHFANVSLKGRRGVQIVGCRGRTVVAPRPKAHDAPVFAVDGGQGITLSDLDIVAPFGIAVALDGRKPRLDTVRIEGCRIMALTYGILAETVRKLTVADNQVWQLDHVAGIAAIALRADDALVERNLVGVWPFDYEVPEKGSSGEERPLDPSGPCIEPEDFFGNLTAVLIYVVGVWTAVGVALPVAQPYRARGGIHVRGGSTRVDLIANRIQGGLGHGITLGGILPGQAAANDTAGGTDEEQPAPAKGTAKNGSFAAIMVDERGGPVENDVIALTRKDRIRFADSTDSAGKAMFKAEDGEYDLAVKPGHKIVRVAQEEQDGILVHTVTIRADDIQIKRDPDKGFLTRIRILDNQIERMGLSGVGFWFYDTTPVKLPQIASVQMDDLALYLSAVMAPRELIGTVNIVRDLEIRNNRIEGNLRAGFTNALTAAGLVVAQGGLSLGLVEGVSVADNHIAGNGVTAANACAGIYVGYGEEVRISGNYVAGNGPVGADYREARDDGLRSGIFVRMASTVLAGGAEDSLQKPALVIRDNVVDQPAGRAITAFAYGPVTCAGNTLNAEVEGAWNVFDELVGGIFLFNLGGLHRWARLTGQKAKAFTAIGRVDHASAIDADYASDQIFARLEALMPGGETLVNSNQLRTGPDNRALCPQLIVTLDDLGYGCNQSSAFLPSVTFANLVAVANSLRVTDNRFRERAVATAMSALTWTGGITLAAGNVTMNVTSQNQGDHCIVALANGSMPPVDGPNQVAIQTFCPQLQGQPAEDHKTKTAFVLQSLLAAWVLKVNPQVTEALDGMTVTAGLSHAVDDIELMKVDAGFAYEAEAVRLKADGAADKQALAEDLTLRAKQFTRASGALKAQKDVLTVKVAPTPSKGALLDGRVSDTLGRGAGKALVELVDRRGQALGPKAVTDDTGYYAVDLSPETLETLKETGTVYVRVLDARGQELARDVRPLVFDGARRLNVDVALPRRPILSARLGGGRVVFDTPTRPVTPVTPTKPVRPPVEPDQPATPVVRLEDVRGIGVAIAKRLREAGVEDAAGILALDRDKLIEILGYRGEAIRIAAAAVIEAARGGTG